MAITTTMMTSRMTTTIRTAVTDRKISPDTTKITDSTQTEYKIIMMDLSQGTVEPLYKRQVGGGSLSLIQWSLSTRDNLGTGTLSLIQWSLSTRDKL